MDREGLYADHTLNVLYGVGDLVDIRAVLAVLNSTLVNWYFRKKHIGHQHQGRVPHGGAPAAALRLLKRIDRAPRLAELAESLLAPTRLEARGQDREKTLPGYSVRPRPWIARSIV